MFQGLISISSGLWWSLGGLLLVAYALILWVTSSLQDEKWRFALRAIRNVGGVMFLSGLLITAVAGFRYTFNAFSIGLAQIGTALLVVLLLVLGTIVVYRVKTRARQRRTEHLALR